MQSSSAAAAATLVALNAGSLTFDQACAMIVGQSVGTAATSAMDAAGCDGLAAPGRFKEGAETLAAWLDATKDPEAAPGPPIFEAMESASKRLTDERKAGRDKILQDIALQRMPAVTARNGLDMLGWADGALYRAWRLAESLRIASGKQPAG
jgi:hypothetical protein